MGDIGNRIKIERDRLGLKQDALGVAPKTQRFYESGERSPDCEYLKLFASLGADVIYIITGYRAQGVLTGIHQNLIEAYEAAPENLRQAVFAVLLSPYKSELLKKPIEIPGYFQHEILGEDDARFEAHHSASRPVKGKST